MVPIVAIRFTVSEKLKLETYPRNTGLTFDTITVVTQKEIFALWSPAHFIKAA